MRIVGAIEPLLGVGSSRVGHPVRENGDGPVGTSIFFFQRSDYSDLRLFTGLARAALAIGLQEGGMGAALF